MKAEEHTYGDKKISSRKKKKGISIPKILGGDILKEDFVMKQSKLIILIAFLFVIFISNRYACLKKIAEIEGLKRELKDAKYESLIISKQLTSNSKESQIETLINQRGLGLEGASHPAYEIKMDKGTNK